MPAERTPEQEAAIARVEEARRLRELLADEAKTAEAALAAAAVEARRAGLYTSEIARLAGLTRDGLNKLLERHGGWFPEG